MTIRTPRSRSHLGSRIPPFPPRTRPPGLSRIRHSPAVPPARDASTLARCMICPAWRLLCRRAGRRALRMTKKRKTARSTPAMAGSPPLPASLEPEQGGFPASELFLSLPSGLVVAIEHELRTALPDHTFLQRERARGGPAGNHTTEVGWWHGRRVGFHLLGRLPLRPASGSPTDRFRRAISWLSGGWQRKDAQVEHALGVGEPRLAWAHEARAAYCSWLLSNPAFVREHDDLLYQHAATIRAYGIPELKSPNLDGLPAGFIDETDRQPVDETFSRFFGRWRLARLPAPYLPEPLSPQIPLHAVGLVSSGMREGGRLFYLPDILPVPSRDDLRSVLEDSLRARSDGAHEHLTDWMRLVCGSNPAKNAITTLARRLRLQHFWRVLHLRHAPRLTGQVGRLEQAFAQFLDVSVKTVHRDLGEIASSLANPDWYRDQAVLARFCAPPEA